jgi:hypothetical protein
VVAAVNQLRAIWMPADSAVLLSQYLPEQYEAVREASWPTRHALLEHSIGLAAGAVRARLQPQPRNLLSSTSFLH